MRMSDWSSDVCSSDLRALELMPDDLPALFLPMMPVGLSPEHAAFPGTLTLAAETVLRLWTDIGLWVARSGLRKPLIFNSHRSEARRVGKACVSTVRSRW